MIELFIVLDCDRLSLECLANVLANSKYGVGWYTQVLASILKHWLELASILVYSSIGWCWLVFWYTQALASTLKHWLVLASILVYSSLG